MKFFGVRKKRAGVNAEHLSMLNLSRKYELDLAMRYFPKAHDGGRRMFVLEIGSGTGEQAKVISEQGYDVLAIDVPQSHYRDERVFHIIDYDGKVLPLDDGGADVVFSSNVLEHVEGIYSLLDEMHRVMQPGGTAVHVLPSSSCRLWSIPAHYGWLARRIFRLLFSYIAADADPEKKALTPRRPDSVRGVLGTLFPLRHGERGWTVTEAYYYSRRWWINAFEGHGFEVKAIESTGLFYSMANVFGEKLSIQARREMAKWMGSSCNIFVLRRR